MATNTLGNYNETFFAQEGLIQLEKALGMAARVHRGFEAERNASFRKGSVINLRRPSTFTAADAPSAAQNIDTESLSISLTNWKEVKFEVPDNELAWTGEQIINDHIRPAAYALADNIDQALCNLYSDVPWYYTTNASPGTVVTDITGARKVLSDNAVPVFDTPNMHLMADTVMENNLLSNSAFGQWQGSGQTGVNTQLSGQIGPRFGMNVFANQNVKSHTTTAISLATPTVTGATAKGATSIVLAGTTFTGTLKKGDIITLVGHTQAYAVAADVTAGSNTATVTITPSLRAAVSNGTVWAAVQAAADGVQRLAWHKNAFALALAPLPRVADGLGARIDVASDPITGLSLRSRIGYDFTNSKMLVALDILFGYRTLDPNLACRLVV